MPDKIVYKEELVKLIALQDVDVVIFDLNEKSAAFPELISSIDKSLEDKKTALNTAEDDLKKLQVLKNQKETEMQSKEELIKKHQAQLFQIKNNKEYSALQHEIDSIKADISLVEEDIIKLFDQIDAAKALVEKEKKIFNDEKSKAESEKSGIKAEEAKINSELARELTRKEELSKTVDAATLTQYEKILKSRGRSALSKVIDDRCGVCNIALRPQVLNEAKLKRTPVLCENCYRILYAED